MARSASGTFAADGQSSSIVISNHEYAADGAFIWLGSDAGTNFGGGTVTIQMKNLSGTFVDIPGYSYTTTTALRLNAPNNAEIRLSLTGSTTPDLDYELYRMSLK